MNEMSKKILLIVTTKIVGSH